MISARLSDERRWDRVPVEIPVELFHAPAPDGCAAQALDLSWNGARVRGRNLDLRLGQRVEVVLQSSKGWDRRAARVVWVDQTDRALGEEAGLEFLQPVINPP